VLKGILVFLLITSFVFSSIQSREEKKLYKEDVNKQFERMYEYSVKPMSGKKRDRAGGKYWVELEYGDLSEKQKNMLISDIKNDGFRDPYQKKKCDGRHFCKDKIAIAILEYNEPKRVRIMIVNNDYDEEKR